VKPGEVYKHENFYLNREMGELQVKFFMVLALTPSDDIISRLLTSRAHGRREAPPCFHGDPYPGYFLGVPGNPLKKKSWLDLRKFGDLDSSVIDRNVKKGLVTHVVTVAGQVLFDLMECAANAEDTTALQSRYILDALSRIRNG
jgi:hypothetical protein